jgi:Leucine-rich repeat (LRR) protein
LPPLPHNLRTLICSNNNLETLPTLPPGLTILACDNNILKSLPALPKTLQTLNCCGNFLKEIPELPASLSALVCYANELKFLPDMKHVTLLKASHNPWNPRFAEIMTSEDCIQMIREFYRNMRLTKESARNALNVTILKDRLPDDLVHIVGSFMTGKNNRLDMQLMDLYEGVMDANDSLVADKNKVRKRVGSMAVTRGWWLKWHKEKLGLL